MLRLSLGVVALAVTLGPVGGLCEADARGSSASRGKVPQETGVLAARQPEAVPPPTKLALLALAKGSSVTVHPEAGSSAGTTTLSNPTVEETPLAMMVVDRQDDWLQVRVPERPNGALVWIKAEEVDLTPVKNRVVINLGQRLLHVLDENQQTIFETKVAVGKPATPTPTGRFFIDVWLPNPGHPYGDFLLGVSAFSDVLRTFMGGRGQVAMHGWKDASVMGKNVSNGCIRMRNADIMRLSELAPLGTPIEILG